MKFTNGPLADPAEMRRIDRLVMPPLIGLISGELTADRPRCVMGAARTSGIVTDAWISMYGCGRDDTNGLSGEVDIKINGTSIFTTKPIIRSNHSEAAAHKTTKVSGDKEITQAAINPSARSFVAGDVFTFDFDITRTASPTTEMSNLVVVAELEESKPIR